MARKRRWKQRIRTARPSVHVIQARMTDGSHRPEGGDKALGSRLKSAVVVCTQSVSSYQAATGLLLSRLDETKRRPLD
jgi:hypothetical protein